MEIVIGVVMSVVMGVVAAARPQPNRCPAALIQAEHAAIQFRVPLDTFKDTLMKVCPGYRPDARLVSGG